MTCEDCLYYNFCKNQYGETDYFDGGGIVDDVEKYCGKAEDKSKYIKLPFRIGETVYVLTNKNGVKACGKEIIKCEITNMRFKQDGKTVVYSCRGSYSSGNYYSDNFVFNSIGETVFLSQEEAEKALDGMRNGL